MTKGCREDFEVEKTQKDNKDIKSTNNKKEKKDVCRIELIRTIRRVTTYLQKWYRGTDGWEGTNISILVMMEFHQHRRQVSDGK